jgi:hypothetical protein
MLSNGKIVSLNKLTADSEKNLNDYNRKLNRSLDDKIDYFLKRITKYEAFRSSLLKSYKLPGTSCVSSEYFDKCYEISKQSQYDIPEIYKALNYIIPNRIKKYRHPGYSQQPIINILEKLKKTKKMMI